MMTEECSRQTSTSEAIIDSLVDDFQKSNEVFDLEKIVAKKKKKHKSRHADGDYDEKTKKHPRKEKKHKKKDKKTDKETPEKAKEKKHYKKPTEASESKGNVGELQHVRAISSDEELPLGADFTSVQEPIPSTSGVSTSATMATKIDPVVESVKPAGPDYTYADRDYMPFCREEVFPLSKKVGKVEPTFTQLPQSKPSEILTKVTELKGKPAAFVPRKVQLKSDLVVEAAKTNGISSGAPKGPIRGAIRNMDLDQPAAEDDDELQLGRPVIQPPPAAEVKATIKIGQIGKIAPTPETENSRAATTTGQEEGELAVSDAGSSSAAGVVDEDSDGEIRDEPTPVVEKKTKKTPSKVSKRPAVKTKDVKKKRSGDDKKKPKPAKKERRKRSLSVERIAKKRKLRSRSRTPLPRTPPAIKDRTRSRSPRPRRVSRSSSSGGERSVRHRAPRSRTYSRSRSPMDRRRRSRSRSPRRGVPVTSYRPRSPVYIKRGKHVEPTPRDKAAWPWATGTKRRSPRRFRGGGFTDSGSRSRRSRSRSKDRRRSRSRSRSKKRRARSRSRTNPLLRKSRSRSASSRRKKSKVVNETDKPKKLDDDDQKIDKKKLYEIALRNVNHMCQDGSLQHQLTVLGPDGVARLKSRGRTMDELVDYCKKLQKREDKANRKAAGETVSSGEDDKSEEELDFIHHPFELKPAAPITFSIPNASMLPTRTPLQRAIEDGTQLRITYPVSSGAAHRDKDSEWTPVESDTSKVPTVCETDKEKMKLAIPPPHKEKEKALASILPPPPKAPTLPILLPAPPPAPFLSAATPPSAMVFNEPRKDAPQDVTPVVSQRLEAMKRLQNDPNDYEAHAILADCDDKMKAWAESKHVPGLFTGSTGVAVLRPEQLEPTDPRFNSWAKKDLFKNADKVTSSVGLKLMQKMGWKPGEGLGKERDGNLEPLMLDVKSDRKGLVAIEEMPSSIRKPVSSTFGSEMTGKHPVSVLMELCSKRRWGPPQFTCVESGGITSRRFLWKVIVNGVEYQPAVPSGNKKNGKMHSAQVVLQSLGLVPRDASLPVIIG